jgi:hypothetical protein
MDWSKLYLVCLRWCVEMCWDHKKQLTVGVCEAKLFCWKVHHVTEWYIDLLSHNLKGIYIYKLMSIKCEKRFRSHQTSTALLMPVTVATSTGSHVPSLLTHPHDKVHLRLHPVFKLPAERIYTQFHELYQRSSLFLCCCLVAQFD